MAINIKLITAATLISVAAVSCKGCKNILGCESSYTFQLNSRVAPDKDTISKGDTIWLEINAPVVFTDQQSGQQINYSNASNLGTDMGFLKLINRSPTQMADAVDSFDFVLSAGTEIGSPNPHLIKEYLIKQIGDRYLFKLGIIAKDTGTYGFNLGNPVNVEQDNKPCPKADFNIIMVQTSQHYYLFPGGDTITSPSSNYWFHVR